MLRWNKTGITIVDGNQLNTPFDVVVDYANNLYVVNYGNSRVQKFLFGNFTGQIVAGNGTPGASAYELNHPSKLVIDSNENLYISDTVNHRIQLWKKGTNRGETVAGITGTFNIILVLLGTKNVFKYFIGSPGNAVYQLSSPYGITLNPTTNTLYVSDYNNHRIMSYAPGTVNGTLLLGGNGPGFSNTQLHYPVGLHYDSLTNSLIIANILAHNIVRYTFGSNNWTLVAGNSSGYSGSSSNLLLEPPDITLDPMGNLYVADRNNHRIQLFYNGQFNGITIAGITGVSSVNTTTLDWPWSVKLDSQLNLYVADAYNYRIQKFLRY